MNQIHHWGNSPDFGGKIPRAILAHPIKIVAQVFLVCNSGTFS